MSHKSAFKFLFALCGLAAVAICASSTLNAQSKGQWTTLFKGSDVSALRGYKMAAFPTAGWIIRDGELRTDPNATKETRVDLVSREKYKDFELEYEWRISPGGNSGVMYRVAETEGPAWHTGAEMQILDDDKHPDAKLGINGNRQAGTLYDLIPTNSSKRLKPVGEFNKARVVIKNNRVEHFLNGAKVVEYEMNSPQFMSLVASSKFKDYPRFAREPEGFICLQHHGEEVAFRNIRIRRL